MQKIIIVFTLVFNLILPSYAIENEEKEDGRLLEVGGIKYSCEGPINESNEEDKADAAKNGNTKNEEEAGNIFVERTKAFFGENGVCLGEDENGRKGMYEFVCVDFKNGGYVSVKNRDECVGSKKHKEEREFVSCLAERHRLQSATFKQLCDEYGGLEKTLQCIEQSDDPFEILSGAPQPILENLDKLNEQARASCSEEEKEERSWKKCGAEIGCNIARSVGDGIASAAVLNGGGLAVKAIGATGLASKAAASGGIAGFAYNSISKTVSGAIAKAFGAGEECSSSEGKGNCATTLMAGLIDNFGDLATAAWKGASWLYNNPGKALNAIGNGVVYAGKKAIQGAYEVTKTAGKILAVGVEEGTEYVVKPLANAGSKAVGAVADFFGFGSNKHKKAQDGTSRALLLAQQEKQSEINRQKKKVSALKALGEDLGKYTKALGSGVGSIGRFAAAMYSMAEESVATNYGCEKWVQGESYTANGPLDEKGNVTKITLSRPKKVNGKTIPVDFQSKTTRNLVASFSNNESNASKEVQDKEGINTTRDSGPVCEKPYNGECATCNQRLNNFCGAAGYILPEIAGLIFTGGVSGALSGVKSIAGATVKGLAATQKFQSVARAIQKYPKLAKALSIAQKVGGVGVHVGAGFLKLGGKLLKIPGASLELAGKFAGKLRKLPVIKQVTNVAGKIHAKTSKKVIDGLGGLRNRINNWGKVKVEKAVGKKATQLAAKTEKKLVKAKDKLAKATEELRAARKAAKAAPDDEIAKAALAKAKKARRKARRSVDGLDAKKGALENVAEDFFKRAEKTAAGEVARKTARVAQANDAANAKPLAKLKASRQKATNKLNKAKLKLENLKKGKNVSQKSIDRAQKNVTKARAKRDLAKSKFREARDVSRRSGNIKDFSKQKIKVEKASKKLKKAEERLREARAARNLDPDNRAAQIAVLEAQENLDKAKTLKNAADAKLQTIQNGVKAPESIIDNLADAKASANDLANKKPLAKQNVALKKAETKSERLKAKVKELTEKGATQEKIEEARLAFSRSQKKVSQAQKKLKEWKNVARRKGSIKEFELKRAEVAKSTKQVKQAEEKLEQSKAILKKTPDRKSAKLAVEKAENNLRRAQAAEQRATDQLRSIQGRGKLTKTDISKEAAKAKKAKKRAQRKRAKEKRNQTRKDEKRATKKAGKNESDLDSSSVGESAATSSVAAADDIVEEGIKKEKNGVFSGLGTWLDKQKKSVKSLFTKTDKVGQPLKFRKAKGVIRRSKKSLKNVNPEVQLKAIEDLGQLRIAPTKASDKINAEISSVIHDLDDLLRTTKNPQVRKKAAEALVDYSRANTTGFRRGYLGKETEEILNSIYQDTSLTHDVRRVAYDGLKESRKVSGLPIDDSFKTSKGLEEINRLEKLKKAKLDHGKKYATKLEETLALRPDQQVKLDIQKSKIGVNAPKTAPRELVDAKYVGRTDDGKYLFESRSGKKVSFTDSQLTGRLNPFKTISESDFLVRQDEIASKLFSNKPDDVAEAVGQLERLYRDARKGNISSKPGLDKEIHEFISEHLDNLGRSHLNSSPLNVKSVPPEALSRAKKLQNALDNSFSTFDHKISNGTDLLPTAKPVKKPAINVGQVNLRTGEVSPVGGSIDSAEKAAKASVRPSSNVGQVNLRTGEVSPVGGSIDSAEKASVRPSSNVGQVNLRTGEVSPVGGSIDSAEKAAKASARPSSNVGQVNLRTGEVSPVGGSIDGAEQAAKASVRPPKVLDKNPTSASNDLTQLRADRAKRQTNNPSKVSSSSESMFKPAKGVVREKTFPYQITSYDESVKKLNSATKNINGIFKSRRARREAIQELRTLKVDDIRNTSKKAKVDKKVKSAVKSLQNIVLKTKDDTVRREAMNSLVAFLRNNSSSEKFKYIRQTLGRDGTALNTLEVISRNKSLPSNIKAIANDEIKVIKEAMRKIDRQRVRINKPIQKGPVKR